ncbi:MAG: ankyrin repeat domain-containing protein [Gemmatimonadetes bacterium]|nr:ankyrin repeat domain-containing protein [Gemmatimonadota bacterium]
MSVVSLPYFEAIRSCDLARLQSVLDDAPSVAHSVLPKSDAADGTGGCTGLHLAVHSADVEIARLLISSGVDLEARSEDGRTALHDSIEYGKREIETLLLESGSEVDVCAAAILGRIEHVRELLDQDPDLVNDRSTNLSPLGWASYGNQTEVAAELISRGARLDDGELLRAASVGHVEVGRLLLKHGADPDEMDEKAGGSALHAAVRMRYTCDSTEFVRMLLAAGADPRITTRNGMTALQLAEDCARRQSDTASDEASQELTRNFEGVAEILRNA